MRNGTHSSRLVLVDDSRPDAADNVDYTNEYDYSPQTEPHPSLGKADRADRTRATLIALMSVSIACTTAAIATASYAAWLARRQATRQALTDVNDLLKTCQSRMRQLEADVQSLPSR